MNTRRRKLNGWTTFDTVVTVIVGIALVITLYPLLYVFSCSISDPNMVSGGMVVLLPKGFSTLAYEIVMKNNDFWYAMLVTVFYCVITCSMHLVTTIFVAYPLTRKNLKFRRYVVYFLLIPMYFGGGMIPTFMVVTKLGLYNSIWALVLPGVGISNIILCRTFMMNLPAELSDAALIDGCGQWKNLWKIVVPLSKPVLAVISMFNLVSTWNNWFNASIYITKKELKPIQLYMKEILASVSAVGDKALMSSLSVEEQLKMMELAKSANQIRYAMIILTAAPILCVYPMFQKHFAKGIMVGSLKG